jgi:hypothetical protein
MGPIGATVLLLAVAGCTGAAEPAASPSDAPAAATGRATASSATPLTPSPAPSAPITPTAAPTPLPLPAIDLGEPLVWYAPNMGSVDFPELFSRPERWSSARDRVDVFQFYGNTVSGDPYDIGGDNVLDTFVDVGAFGRLHDWDIATAIETGVIKWFACTHGSWAEYANRGIDNVESNGGRVSFVAMDEPLLGGQISEGGVGCDYTPEEAAAEVAAFVTAVRAEHPEVEVGTIEAYPHYPIRELEAWITALGRAAARPAFFHLDVDIERVRVEGQNVAADLRRLRGFCDELGVPFGVILTSNWTAAGSDEGYYDSTLQWASMVNDGMGKPTHVILQSWQGPAASGRHEVPVNLPEDDPDVHSHTRLLLEAVDVFDAAATAE